MAGDLPYFKWFPDEWFAGKIQSCSLKIQGLFTNICSLYWKRRGDVCSSDIIHRFKNSEEGLNELLKIGVIRLEKGTRVQHMLREREEDKEEDKKEKESTKESRLVISFLDEQLIELGAIQKKRVHAGKESGIRRRQNRDDILAKKVKTFKKMIHPHTDKYEEAMIQEFISYWTETKPAGIKMRWEMQAAFDVGKRLGTWNKNYKTSFVGSRPKNTVGSRLKGSPIKKYRKSKEL